jgi:hypothetical protein
MIPNSKNKGYKYFDRPESVPLDIDYAEQKPSRVPALLLTIGFILVAGFFLYFESIVTYVQGML